MLSDLEKDILQILLNNEPLMSSLRKIFELSIETNKPQIIFTDNNELLGERYRSYELAQNIVQTAFTLLNSYKKGEKVVKTINKAR